MDATHANSAAPVAPVDIHITAVVEKTFARLRCVKRFPWTAMLRSLSSGPATEPAPGTRRLKPWMCLLAAVSCGMVSAAPGSPPPVNIEIGPERLEYRTFPKGMPPPCGLLSPNETLAGCCDTDFLQSCSMSCEGPRLSFARASAKVVSIRIETALTVTIWTEEGSGPAVMQHEEAHRTIAKHYYALTERVAREHAARILGRKIPFPRPNEEAEGTGPLNELQAELLDALQRETAARSEVAQAKFDAYTYGEPASKTNEAMAQALAEEEAEYAAAAARR